MLLRPSNTLLLDEPTNHLDLDSKDVLLDALEDYGGTLIFVSHDRYFVERLANRIVEVGGGELHSFPGTYEEFLWRKAHPPSPGQDSTGRASAGQVRHGQAPTGRASAGQVRHGHESTGRASAGQVGHGHESTGRASAASGKAGGGKADGTAAGKPHAQAPPDDREARRQAQIVARRLDRAAKAHQAKIAGIEEQIARCEAAIKDLEAAMAGPGFYDDRAAAQPVIDRHQALMWEVGDLMHQWEVLQTADDASDGPAPAERTGR
jgi:ATP-binding cassette subfamily F protein 3